MGDARRYGNRKVSKMYAQINELRAAIRAEGTDRIQEAWDKVEEHIDFAYSPENATPSPNIRHDPGLEAGETGE